MFTTSTLAAGLLALLPAQAAPSSVPEELAPARARAARLVDDGQSPSVVVGVGRDGVVVWREGFGLADADRGIAATPSTPYRVASLTKSITGTGVALLAAERAVELDAPVVSYLEGRGLRIPAGHEAEVTVRRVLQHSGGIPHGWESYPWNTEERGRTRDSIANAIVAFHPDRGFLYSNYAYGVAEEVIVEASGTSYAEFLATRLFEPLGMIHGGPVVTDDLVRRSAREYDGAGNAYPPSRFVPAGGAGAFASVDDLLRYGFFHLGDLDLPEDAPVRAASASQWQEPLGFASPELDDGSTWLLSNGRFAGVCSNMTLVPSEGLVVVVLASRGTMLADELALSIVDDLVPGFANRAQAFIAAFEREHALGRFEPEPDLIGTWEGRIACPVRDVPFTLTFEENGEAWAVHDDAHETPLGGLRGGAALLTTSFSADLPYAADRSGALPVTLELMLDGGRLIGSATGTWASEAGSFRVPAFVELVRAD